MPFSFDYLVARFPSLFPSGSHMENKDRVVRDQLIAALLRHLHVSAYLAGIEKTIGKEGSHRDMVSIPIILKDGRKITLYGGWIHATDFISWDFLDRDQPSGDYEDKENRFESTVCITTPEMFKVLTILLQ